MNEGIRTAETEEQSGLTASAEVSGDREPAEYPDLAGHPHVQCRTAQRDPQGVGMPYAERPGVAIDI